MGAVVINKKVQEDTLEDTLDIHLDFHHKIATYLYDHKYLAMY